jgi:hypothetical protein
MIETSAMAWRPEGKKDDALTRKELKELKHRLSYLSIPAVEDFYRSAHTDARSSPDGFPSPRSVQDLVQAWKQLRKWRG